MCVTYFTELAEFLRSRDLRVFYEGLHHVALILLFSTLLRSGRHDESCESEPKLKLRVELGNKLNSLQCRGERQHITHDPPVYSLLVAVNHLLHIPHPHLYVKNILISSLWDKNNVSWWVTLSLQPCGVFLEKAGLNVERGIAPGASAASRRTKVFFQGILSLQVSWATKEALSIEQTVISHHSNADLTDGFFWKFCKKKWIALPVGAADSPGSLHVSANLNLSFLPRCWSSLGQERNQMFFGRLSSCLHVDQSLHLQPCCQ